MDRMCKSQEWAIEEMTFFLDQSETDSPRKRDHRLLEIRYCTEETEAKDGIRFEAMHCTLSKDNDTLPTDSVSLFLRFDPISQQNRTCR